MVGRFTTLKYKDRPAYEAGRPYDVGVSHNSFTRVGLEWIWQMVAGELRQQDGTLNDHLGSARLLVGNSSQAFDFQDERLAGELTAQAALDTGYPQIARDGENQAMVITLRSTFGETDAIFDWMERGVVSAQGILIDRAVKDQGRKVLGSIWTLEAQLIIGNPAS